MATTHPGHHGRVDGNAAGGDLLEIFGRDVTAARATCAECHRVAALADAIAEIDDAGVLLLCRGCTHTLLTYVRSGAGGTLALDGLALLEWESDPSLRR